MVRAETAPELLWFDKDPPGQTVLLFSKCKLTTLLTQHNYGTSGSLLTMLDSTANQLPIPGDKDYLAMLVQKKQQS